MRKVFISLCLVMGLTASAATAVNGQIITINGETVDKVATELTFDGDNVILHYLDGTSQSADMTTVTISFDNTNGIGSVRTFALKNSTDGFLDISGVDTGQTIRIYDMGGKMIATAKASGSSTVMDIRNMQGGMYILRAGNDVVKFIKR